MTKTLIQQLRAARKVSVPIIGICTPDPAATILESDQWAAAGMKAGDVPAVIVWDCIQGPRPHGMTEAIRQVAIEAIAKMGAEPELLLNPVELLRLGVHLPPATILFVHMANRWLTEPAFLQASWNLRDQFKRDRRTLVLLGPTLELPAELTGDVVAMDEPLPGRDALEDIIRQQHADAGLTIDAGTLQLATEAIQGLPAFQCEQIVAMSLSKSGLNVPELWERKRRQIEQTPGLKVHREAVKFSDIGGVAVIKDFLKRITQGKARPNAVVFIDEIEKFMAGSGGSGDTSGVSQDQLGTLLAYMQDHNAAGMIFVGPPGSAKSMVAKAAGCEADIPTIQLDLGAMKGSLVGQSEQQLRAALKVITSVSNGQSLWIATCNSITDLPPELRRRFTLGTFFFDLPEAEERRAIWKLYTQAKTRGELPDDEGWTGAEIRACCDIAGRIDGTLAEAARFIVPVSKSAAEQVGRLRKSAEGRFLSASKPGTYRQPAERDTHTTAKRQVSL